MNRISEIWALLEEKENQPSGLIKVRYSDRGHSDLYLGMKYPEGHRLLLMRADATDPRLPENRDFRGLRLEKIYDTSVSGKIFLSLILTDVAFAGVFDTIVQDVAEAVLQSFTLSPVGIFVDRIEKWRAVFEQFAPEGLSRSEQYGLYGELLLLHKLLSDSAASYYGQIVNSWTGPKKAIHDFQYGICSVEVKVTTGNNHQKIQISNERQLDASNTPELYLCHLSLEVRQKGGETLNELIDKIFSLLSSDFTIQARFRTGLTEAGFFEHQRSLYAGEGYVVRQQNFYTVEGDFPRIEERAIRKGVGDVKYSIIVDQFSIYNVPQTEILRKFGINDE